MHTGPQEDSVSPEETGGGGGVGGAVLEAGRESGSSWCAESRGSGWLVKSFSLLSSICQGPGL